jgi:hypothetical protein
MKKNTSPLQKKTSKKNKPELVDIISDTIEEVISDVNQEEIFGEIDGIEIDKVLATLPKEVLPEKKIKPKDKVHYVNSREFEDRIKVFYTTGNISYELGDSLNKIANGLSYAPNFINYSYKDEMVGDAIVKMFSALRNKKFKIDSGFSPFSYFTTIAFHAFINRIKKEKKHHEVINEYKEKVYNDLMLDANESGNGYIYVEPTGDDDNDE